LRLSSCCCDGIGPHYHQGAQRLAGWGYAALLIDSFGPRGFQEVCNWGLLVPPEAQARDAFDGAAYLRTALLDESG
jgi:dienelactone hydrolase